MGIFRKQPDGIEGSLGAMSCKIKRKPAKRDGDKPDNSGLARLLRKRKPIGGVVMLAKYNRLKNVAA
jgi:hypothetical protein